MRLGTGAAEERRGRQRRVVEGRAALQRDLGLSPGCASERGHRLSSLSLSPSPSDGDSGP